MARNVCPWWVGYILASPLRRLRQDPYSVVGPFLSEGMLVLEPGPGMGFFTLDMARAVGPMGRVIAVDIQERMLASLARRARKAGLAERIECRLAGSDSLGIADLEGKVDLVFAFAMVHEVPDRDSFFRQTAAALKHRGRLLFVEPAGHVDHESFAASVRSAVAAGLREEERPSIPKNHAVLLRKA